MASTHSARIRLRLGVSQVRFATLLAVHPMTVSKWERGVLRPNRRQAALLRAVDAASRGRPADGAVRDLLGLLNDAFMDVSEIGGMKLSASNQLKGRIVTLEKGPVSARVVIEIVPRVRITSVITTASAERLSLRIGKRVVAIIKATEVIIGAE